MPRTYTTTHTVYRFNELTEVAKDKAVTELWDINVNHDWWEPEYEYLMGLGIVVDHFDIGRAQSIGLMLTKDLQVVCRNILAEESNMHPLHETAEKYLFKHGEDNEERFIGELSQPVLSMLKREYYYLISDEAIRDTIEANDYEFTFDGVKS